MRVNVNTPALFTRRLIAYILDVFIVFFIIISPFKYNLKSINFSFTNITSVLSAQSSLLIATSIIIVILIILYWTIFDYLFNQTIGKMMMNIQVVSLNKELAFTQALLRNISKFSTLILFIDSLPLILRTSNKRYLEKASNTEVLTR